jgi:hypothetical protein
MKTDLLLDDLLFEVEERPVYAGAGANRYTPVPGRKAIVRRDDGHVLGVVGRDYRLVTNQEAMDAARLCCRQVFPKTKPEEWQFSTAEAPATRSSCTTRRRGLAAGLYLRLPGARIRDRDISGRFGKGGKAVPTARWKKLGRRTECTERKILVAVSCFSRLPPVLDSFTGSQ